MSPASQFPSELLKRPPEARLQYFKDFTVGHPRLVQAKDRLMAAIRNSSLNSLVVVAGPTGVGKTTLLTKIQQLLTTEALEELEADRGRLPFVTIEAMSPDSRGFNWRNHFRRMLLQMDEPLVDSKLRQEGERTWGAFFPGEKALGADFYYAVEQALRYRRPRAVLIDEAQHIFTVASGRRQEDQLNVIKSLANRSESIHVLCGTYELVRFRNLNGQLSRRSGDIHFSRYDATKSEDSKTFIRIIRAFEQQLPLPEPPDLARHWEYLYERTIGCIGVLKDWLVKAFADALREPIPVLTLEHLEAHALSVPQCEKMIEDVRGGEMQFFEDKDARERLLRGLGLPISQSGAPESQSSDASIAMSRRRPGHRAPKRDLVGRRAVAKLRA